MGYFARGNFLKKINFSLKKGITQNPPQDTSVFVRIQPGPPLTDSENFRILRRVKRGVDMNLFDILGPVMVGPSSSHTAGAVRIGLITRRLLGSEPKKADIALAGSFAATGRGHGTDRALAAGLLGMQPDDIRIPDIFGKSS